MVPSYNASNLYVILKLLSSGHKQMVSGYVLTNQFQHTVVDRVPSHLDEQESRPSRRVRCRRRMNRSFEPTVDTVERGREMFGGEQQLYV